MFLQVPSLKRCSASTEIEGKATSAGEDWRGGAGAHWEDDEVARGLGPRPTGDAAGLDGGIMLLENG